jgi:hypothetical protein
VSELTVELNPSGMDELYLECLNACFPGWGGRESFAWCFERQVGGPRADLMVLRSGGTVLAGSAVTYRRVVLSSGASILAGIMTGSWTLPAARSQGCFTRIIEASVEITAGHGGALLLACVTCTNPSSRRLVAAGSGLFPTNYVFTHPAMPPAPKEAGAWTELPVDAEEIARLYTAAKHTPGCCVYYPTEADWVAQIVARPHPTRLIGLPGGERAIVEETATTDRVLYLSGGGLAVLLRRAQERGRQLFAFTAQTEAAAATGALGLQSAPGYLTALQADRVALARTLGRGEPLVAPNDTPLGDPSSPWYLGGWHLQNGDRM